MSDKKKPKKYSSACKTEDVTLVNAEGLEQTYYLKQLMGDQRDEFLEAQKEMGDDKHKGRVANLLTRCMYDPAGSLVTPEFVGSLPSETQMDLFLDAVKLSALDKNKLTEREKNS